ncbi:MAG TPA: site-2 protease family protein, partial [Lacunisphaera sp.]
MQSDWEMGLLWYGVFVFSTVLHEAAHAWTALKLGDDTAARGGQVSLNPLPHIKREPFGMVAVPILSWMAGGWLIGWASAPFNPEWARRHPRHAAVMALAGPAANLFLIVCAAWLIRIGVEWGWFAAPHSINSSRLASALQSGWPEFAATALSVVLSLNLLLFVFNLTPLPPLDGSNAPLLLLPPGAAAR